MPSTAAEKELKRALKKEKKEKKEKKSKSSKRESKSSSSGKKRKRDELEDSGSDAGSDASAPVSGAGSSAPSSTTFSQNGSSSFVRSPSKDERSAKKARVSENGKSSASKDNGKPVVPGNVSVDKFDIRLV